MFSTFNPSFLLKEVTFLLQIALGQMEVIPGRPDINFHTMMSMISSAREQKADIIIFPEMSIPGYLLGDTWEQPAFLRDCEQYGEKIIRESSDICIVFGNIGIDWNKKNNDGRFRKYNACFIAQNGKLLGNDNFPYPFRIKTLQPNYREFDDNRHFYSLLKLADELNIQIETLLQPVLLTLGNRQIRLGCLICEDSWSDDYAVDPSALLLKNGPIDLFINISSSPFTLGKNNKRNRVFSHNTKQYDTPLIYVNNVGLQNNGKTIYTFDGFSTVYNRRGDIVDYCPPFDAQLKCVFLDLSKNSIHPPQKAVPDDQDISTIYQVLNYGITHFLSSIQMKKVVIGVSGGIDSAVSAALYAKILGPENVLLVNMPSIYNSQTTKDLASQLAKNLGCLYAIIPIQEAVTLTVGQISQTPICNQKTGEQFQLSVSSFVAENIQARDRSSRILAGVAAAFGGGFTCNANKSELTVGYSTLYGDQAGFLAAIADLWKHQVYAIARYINQSVYCREVIPEQTITLVPSAELSFDQAVDEGKGDPLIYPYHDYLFRAFVERWHRASPEDILYWYAEGVLEEKIGCQPGLINRIFKTPQEFIADLERWWKLYTGMAVAKRIQAPPVLAVSRRAFGFDHREAQNTPYYTANYQILKKQLLEGDGANVRQRRGNGISPS